MREREEKEKEAVSHVETKSFVPQEAAELLAPALKATTPEEQSEALQTLQEFFSNDITHDDTNTEARLLLKENLAGGLIQKVAVVGPSAQAAWDNAMFQGFGPHAAVQAAISTLSTLQMLPVESRHLAFDLSLRILRRVFLSQEEQGILLEPTYRCLVDAGELL